MATLTPCDPHFNHTIIEIHELPPTATAVTAIASTKEPESLHYLASSGNRTLSTGWSNETVSRADDPLPIIPQEDQQPHPPQPILPLTQLEPVRPNQPVPGHSLANSDGNKARVLTPPEFNSSQLPEADSGSIRHYHVACYILTLLIIAVILLLSLVPSDSLGAGFPILLVLGGVSCACYLGENGHSRTLGQLNRIVSNQALQEYGQKMRTAEAKLVLQMKCYHMEYKRDTKGDKGTVRDTTKPLRGTSNK